MSALGRSATGVDTNVLLRALLQDDATQSSVAAEVLLSFSREAPVFVTQITLAETYWVLRRSCGLSPQEGLAIMRRLLETESLEFDDSEGALRALVLAEQGADFGDALIAGAMELFGVERVVTFDRRAARRLGWDLLVGADESRSR
ncbi:PIN domain-containing protein [Brevibacterium album]|uniref:PIN domain-containing protein n=1 Tax=Brevibacterium album TaxID=417948 RepID=UPI0003FE0E56|nr:type II toxin-antitoxin system VapC family toxin [Brevibacterium album]